MRAENNNQHTGKTRSQKAVEFVNEENGKPNKAELKVKKTKSSIDKTAYNNYKYYKYTDLLGKEVHLTPSQLLTLGREWVAWIKENPNCTLMQTFWNARGISFTTVRGWAEREQEFKELMDLARQEIGNTRESKLSDDYQHIRSRQALYVPEYKEFDIDLLKLKAEIASVLEGQGKFTPEEAQQCILAALEPLRKLRESSNEERQRASEVPVASGTVDTGEPGNEAGNKQV